MQTEADIFKTLGDPTRLQLVVLLKLHGETCVCDLAAALDAPTFRISRHLGVMRDRGFVEARRDGTWMHYRLAEPKSRLEVCLHDCFESCFTDRDAIRRGLERLRESKSCGQT